MDDDIDELMGREDLDLDLDSTERADDSVEHTAETPEEEVAGGEQKEEPQTPEDTEESKEEGAEDVQEEAPEAPEAPKPLTVDDIRTAISDMRNDERTSAKALDDLTDDILKQYYPDGLSNVLVDQQSGKELRSPQDVVDASGGSMTIEEATQWLMNEQYKLDQDINRIKDDARNLAETNANFTDGIQRVLNKYKDVFDKFPDQQQKVYKAYMKQVKMDDKKDLVLSAPDIEEFYDFVMEPYMLAYGNMQANQPPPQPTAEAPKIPDAKPSVNDRLDESGDGGGGKHEADPNNADESLKELFGE